jgi:hypothetical protein
MTVFAAAFQAVRRRECATCMPSAFLARRKRPDARAIGGARAYPVRLDARRLPRARSERFR